MSMPWGKGEVKVSTLGHSHFHIPPPTTLPHSTIRILEDSSFYLVLSHSHYPAEQLYQGGRERGDEKMRGRKQLQNHPLRRTASPPTTPTPGNSRQHNKIGTQDGTTTLPCTLSYKTASHEAPRRIYSLLDGKFKRLSRIPQFILHSNLFLYKQHDAIKCWCRSSAGAYSLHLTSWGSALNVEAVCSFKIMIDAPEKISACLCKLANNFIVSDPLPSMNSSSDLEESIDVRDKYFDRKSWKQN